MANEIKLKIKVDDDGNLKIIGKNAEKAAKGLDRTGKSAQAADRQLKGAAQASANGTKNFSKMAQSISGGLVPAYATLAAQIFAISAAFSFLRSSSEISNLIAGQEALAATTGVAYKSITNGIKEATDGQLQYAEAAKAAAIGTASGLSPDQLNRLAGAAKVASVALGRDLTDSFNRLIRGVTKAEPELLDELGIILRLESATQKYADSIGKLRTELTAFERSQAVAAEVLGQAEEKFGKLERIINPNVFALNKFTASFDTLLNTVKSGVIESLRPLFLFLSENTLGLVSALSLVALPIVKSILPSFKEWGESAGEALQVQERRLKVYRYKLEKTRKTIENFNKTQEEQKSDLAKSAGKILGPTPKSKSGGSAADFLLGRSDTNKTAQRNAQKVLDNAEAQVKKSGAVITGFLKGKNAEQVADLRRSYKQRVALLKGFEQQHRTVWARASSQVKVYAIQSQAALAKVKKAAVTAGAGIARGLGAISAAAGWIGILTLLGTAVFEVYRKFFPIPEEVKKTSKAFEDFAESNKTLNEELSRTFKTLEEPGLLTVKESVESLGNVLNSADLVNKFNELSSYDKKLDPKGFLEANNSFQTLLNTVGKVSPEFKKLAAQFKSTGTFSKEQLAEISRLNEAYIGASQASQRWSESQENLNRALVSLRGAIKVSEYDQILSIIKANRKENEKYNQIAIPLAVERIKAADEELSATKALADGTEESNRNIVEKARAYNQAQEELRKLGEASKYLFNLEIEFAKVSGKIVENQNKILANAKKLSAEKSIGVTFEQKIANIQLKALSRANKELEIKNKIKIAEAEEEAAKRGSDENQKTAASRRLQALKTQLVVQENSNVLAQQRDNIAIRRIRLEDTVLGIQREQFQVEQKIVNLRQKKTASNAGLTGTFGLARAGEQATNAASTLKERLNVAQLILKQAQAAEDKLFDVTNTEGYSEKEGDRIQNEVINAQNRVKALEIETEAFKARGAEIVNSIKAENELLGLKQRSLSISSVENSINQVLLNARKQGVILTGQQTRAIAEEIERQAELNLLIEAQEGLYNTLSSGFENAFSGIIQGTMTVKDAFANLAKSVLQYLAQMIAKMLVFKLIQIGLNAFAFGGSAQVDASQTGTSGSFGIPESGDIGFARYGGVMESPRGYSAGGIARGRQAGYPAILHGTEAVVPLPNGKSIPVEMMGGAQSNNVVVNVNIDSNGNAKQDMQGDQSGADIGKAIASAVQKELKDQKRSGGMLNPYGVA